MLADEPSQITWANQMVDSSGNYVPPLMPVDPTLHWANPPGGTSGRDGTPEFTSTPGPYTGPCPLVIHLHGSHDFEENDGYPEAWWLPVAKIAATPAKHTPVPAAPVNRSFLRPK